jgi:diacylglycerol kinase (ATP)
MTTATSTPLFIVNPMSGAGRTRSRWPALLRAIQRRELEPDVQFTAGVGHGYDLALAALEAGCETIVAVGGDGTVNEIARAVLDTGAGDRVRIGTIPMGTGKDIGKCLGIGRPVDAIRAIAMGYERRVDAGRVSAHDADGNPITRYFLLEASAGWVPEISQSVPRLLKRLGDTAPYLIMTMVKMLGPMGRSFELTVDGQQFDGRYNTISIHNLELWGGDLLVAPGALPDDGCFDMVRWGDLGRTAVLKAIRGQQQGGTHIHMDGIDYRQVTSVQLASPIRSLLDLDGEHGGYLPAHIEMLPAAVRFIAPPPPA